ncbi:MAG: phospholipase [Alphaproteobacteria bacterium]|nr:phospholipase [Alphaproteobacteria bacterium]MBT4711105.1 phospholipase [Alphaproteobacteria bacterium]
MTAKLTEQGLDGPRIAAASGTTRQLVIFLHGYGADGNDLIGLAQQWAALLPDAAFVAPHAPDPCAQAPMGRQWYPIPTTGDPHDNPDILAALDGLDRFITAECEAAALSEISVGLVGFSQGARMALDAGLRRNCAGLIGYSGTTLEPPKPRANRAMPPPILLCHGDADQVVPIDAMFDTLGRLTGPVRWHVAAGLGHGIDQDGLALGGKFLATVFSKDRDRFASPVALKG